MDQNREVREGGLVLFICMAHVVSYRDEFCIPWSLSTSDIVSRSYVGEITQNPVQNTRPLDPQFPQILKIEEVGRTAEQETSRRILSGFREPQP